MWVWGAAGMRRAPPAPRVAVGRRGGLGGVFVLDGEGAGLRWLRSGGDLGGSVEVVAGLSGGETILAAANDAVRDGSVIEAAESAR
ncbi:hypothetical protein ACS49_02075 [Bacillus cereus]|nr:hypothetical protein ACS49_02075 [Bacillus cereus]